MFDSPIAWCAGCGDWVALDQTAEECRRRTGCKVYPCAMAPLLRPAPRRARSAPLHDPARLMGPECEVALYAHYGQSAQEDGDA